MTRIIITALFISNTLFSFGQKSFGIKIYQNTDIFETLYYETRPDKVTEFNNVNFNRISLAVSIDTKRQYTHEIEFLIPELSKSLEKLRFPMNYEFKKGTDFEGQATSYSLRYELSKTLTNNTKRFGFNLGIGVNPYYVLVEYIPNIETRYYASTELYGFALNMIPRIKYKLSQRFSIDLNMPLKIYDLRTEKYRVKNPNLPTRQQTTIDYSNLFFESAYTFRLGLMYKLSK